MPVAAAALARLILSMASVAARLGGPELRNEEYSFIAFS
jgi:hypothetical protein